MKYAIDCRLVLVSRFDIEVTASIAVAIKSREVTARYFQTNAMLQQKDI
jgi:hypothetical protein